MIEQERKSSEHVLVLDAGNSLIGDRDPASSTQGQSSIELMNRLGYDAAALGAKDLELGPDVLKQRIAEAAFPLLSANAFDVATGSRLAAPSTILEIGQHRIGIVGISGAPDSEQIHIRDPRHAAEIAVIELSGQADTIIVLSNAGEAVNQAIASQIRGVDLVIGAAGRVTSSPVQIGGGILVQADQTSPGHAGRYVGVANLELDSQGTILETQWERVALSPEIADDPELVTWVAEHR